MIKTDILKGLIVILITTLGCLPVTGQIKKNKQVVDKTNVTVDFSKFVGIIKPLHGVNDGPFDYGFQSAPITSYHADAGFPYTRLHDVNWPNADAVDVHTIFSDFSADADDPKNYYFDKTDDYIAPIIKNKSEIIYRLGESIEHKTKYFIHPPKDFEKWAKICVNIIRHYNDGWNNGFHYNIKYWEIWNEPESKLMWLGTNDQYFHLYKTTAKAIKLYNPGLRVGGPGTVGVKSGIVKPFLTYCRDRLVPLDFFSWHIYSADPKELVSNSITARSLLDEFGFKNTENFLDEWHFIDVPFNKIFPGEDVSDSSLEKYSNVRKLFAEINGPKGASFAASALILLQNSPIDVATYYNADYYNPFSMFDEFGIPGKVYYAFKAFNQIAKMINRVDVKISSKDSNVAVLAGLAENKESAAILISNFSKDIQVVDIRLNNFQSSGKIHAKSYLTDTAHDSDIISDKVIHSGNAVLKMKLPAYSIGLIELGDSSIPL